LYLPWVIHLLIFAIYELAAGFGMKPPFFISFYKVITIKYKVQEQYLLLANSI
jgi:hypothetical protein